MKWFQGTYTQRFNARHRLSGHLFQSRYKAIPVQAEAAGYFCAASESIHLNPARAGLLDRRKPELLDYRWSSYPLFVGQARLPEWLGRWSCRMRVRDRVGATGGGWAGRTRDVLEREATAAEVGLFPRNRIRQASGRQAAGKNSRHPPAMAPTIKSGSAPWATGSGSKVSGSSREMSSWQAKKRMKGRRCKVP